MKKMCTWEQRGEAYEMLVTAFLFSDGACRKVGVRKQCSECWAWEKNRSGAGAG